MNEPDIIMDWDAFANKGEVFDYDRYVETARWAPEKHRSQKRARKKLDSAWEMYQEGYRELRQKPGPGWHGVKKV